ncbi:hypothetical protein UFOVP176_60 [uncultured Caudovirales phage]|uniref:Uncharacterized protein n=1 Tax=uncultured Caudovirales phage TaxID=2100421 RepID=A0A6J7WD44_9CAUD|nr:hypothetical protein UFOVP176_60 [uncultured Caudovirales phage]
MTLEQYFQLIVNKPVKEHLMFNTAQEYLAILKERFTSLWTKPTTFVDNSVLLEDEDYWAFEMVSQPWIDEHGEAHPLKHTVMIEPHEGTWMQVLEQILDALNDHYGYDIKEQVYYSVKFPMNEICSYTNKPFAGYGRSLNDEILQQLLLAHPEVYEAVPFGSEVKKGIFE